MQQEQEEIKLSTEAILKRMMQISGAKNESELADKLGIQRATLNATKLRDSPPYRHIVRASRIYNRSVDWILFGEESSGAFVTVPLSEARLSAGGGSLETNEQAVKKYAFRADWLKMRGSTAHMRLMRVSGDSMEPTVHDGDMALIDMSQIDCRAGQIYAVAIEDLIYLKRVDKAPGEFILSSENPQYAPIRVPTGGDVSRQVRILGRCIWLCREF